MGAICKNGKIVWKRCSRRYSRLCRRSKSTWRKIAKSVGRSLRKRPECLGRPSAKAPKESFMRDRSATTGAANADFDFQSFIEDEKLEEHQALLMQLESAIKGLKDAGVKRSDVQLHKALHGQQLSFVNLQPWRKANSEDRNGSWPKLILKPRSWP